MRYYYSVSAIDRWDKEGPRSAETSAVALDNLVPAVPKALQAVGGGDRVTLYWLPNTEADLAGYDLYRDGSKVNTTTIASTSFVDTGLNGAITYLYQITARDIHANESTPSAAVIKTPSDLRPAPPPALRASDHPLDKGEVIDLTWTPSPSGASGYRVRRGTASGVYTTTWDLPAQTTFGDSSCTRGQRYYYAVFTLDAAGRESVGSPEASAVSLANMTVAAGGFHTVGTRTDGSVVATGRNGMGQCDVAGWTGITAVAAGSTTPLAGSRTARWSRRGTTPLVNADVSGWTGIIAIAARRRAHYRPEVRRHRGRRGRKTYGQCDVSGWTGITAISAGGGHTVGLKSDGSVVAVGANLSGQCDISSWRNIVAVSAGADHTVGLRADGTVVATGTTPRANAMSAHGQASSLSMQEPTTP